MDARFRWEAPDVIHGEDQRLVDEAMEHQAVLRRIDRGDAGMMALVEQSVRRDDAVEVLQWCPPGRGEILRQILWDILDNILLEWRRRSIRLASHGIAGGLHPLWNVWRQIIGVCRRRQRLASAETARDDGAAHQCTTLTQKPPARCRGNVLIDVDWFGHRKSSVRKQRAYNAVKPNIYFRRKTS